VSSDQTTDDVTDVTEAPATEPADETTAVDGAAEDPVDSAAPADDSTDMGCAVCGSAVKKCLRSSCSSVCRRILSSNSASSDAVGSSP
jgi:hypothetical protein